MLWRIGLVGMIEWRDDALGQTPFVGVLNPDSIMAYNYGVWVSNDEKEVVVISPATKSSQWWSTSFEFPMYLSSGWNTLLTGLNTSSGIGVNVPSGNLPLIFGAVYDFQYRTAVVVHPVARIEMTMYRRRFQCLWSSGTGSAVSSPSLLFISRYFESEPLGFKGHMLSVTEIKPRSERKTKERLKCLESNNHKSCSTMVKVRDNLS